MNRILNISALLLCWLLLSGTAISADENIQGYPRTVVDSAGREVLIKMPVERIIVTNPEAAEAVTLLGSSDKIVGVASGVLKRKEYFPDLQDRPDVGNTDGYNFEMMAKIAEKNDSITPDIVAIFYATHGTQKVADISQGLSQFENISLVGLDFYFSNNMTEELEKLGRIIGMEDRAQKYISWYNGTVDKVKSSVNELPPTKVFFEGSSSEGGVADISTYGSGSGMNSLQKNAGSLNIAEDLGTYPKVDWEWVITQNPDVIVKNYKSSKPGWDPSEKETLQAVIDEITMRPGAEKINAVKNHRVYLFYNDMAYGMECAAGLSYLAKIFHPEIDIDPNEVYRQYLDMLDLKVPDNRIFIYPAA